MPVSSSVTSSDSSSLSSSIGSSVKMPKNDENMTDVDREQATQSLMTVPAVSSIVKISKDDEDMTSVQEYEGRTSPRTPYSKLLLIC